EFLIFLLILLILQLFYASKFGTFVLRESSAKKNIYRIDIPLFPCLIFAGPESLLSLSIIKIKFPNRFNCGVNFYYPIWVLKKN
ncbi:hypothetical protein KKB18_01505, partial [bacterium]|nr:hypothetical protein [bacterium]